MSILWFSTVVIKTLLDQKGDAPDFESSTNRIERFTAQLRDQRKLEIIAATRPLCSKVDAALSYSAHLGQVKPLLAAKKRVFTDTLLAASP